MVQANAKPDLFKIELEKWHLRVQCKTGGLGGNYKPVFEGGCSLKKKKVLGLSVQLSKPCFFVYIYLNWVYNSITLAFFV